MILIISNNQEITTTAVLKWLVKLEKNFLLVHETEVFNIKVINKRIFLSSSRNCFFIEDITSFWYRRGILKFEKLTYKNSVVNAHMDEAQHWLQQYIINFLESKKHLNKQTNSSVNKLIILEMAKKIGLKVPSYFLAEDTADVNFEKNITKTITEGMSLENIFKNKFGFAYTAVVNKKEEKNFYPSFFQHKIEKEFEIRSFYLNEEFYSFAIFSQNDDKTRVDFRNYNFDKPNRNVLYKLPKEVEQKISILMNKLDLNCGSLDFIKSGNNFYFLEINPIGQFLGLSYKTNSNLEKKIAEYL
jgi:ATP-GRASP peptide maturase of grasp-with-spasm system